MAINVSNWSVRGRLAAMVASTEIQLRLKHGEGTNFRVPESDYFYATIRSFGKFEHVKVLSVHGDTLTVVRGQDNTKPQSWPADSCVEVEWNPAQLCEFAKQCTNGTSPTSVPAGTYCLDCTTCIEIGEDGRITAVNGAKKC